MAHCPEAIPEAGGRVCFIISAKGCSPCTKRKAAIFERVAETPLKDKIFEIPLDPYTDRDHRAILREDGIQGFPTVQLS